MSDRAVSRHRAPQRAVTPLSDINGTLTGQLAVIGRSGAIVALSTGLVASVGIPAQAAEISAVTSTPDLPASTHLTMNSLTSAPLAALAQTTRLSASQVVRAPATATVTFETSAFKASPTSRTVVAAQTVGVSSAHARSSSSAAPTVAPIGSARGSSVLAIAARYVGIPYLYGGTTPSGFDCSGFTGYVYRQLGISLPRTANEQMLSTTRISRQQARPGDLVFIVSGGRAYHEGIYAGGGMMYDSPRTGKTVQKRVIWSGTAVFTRVSK